MSNSKKKIIEPIIFEEKEEKIIPVACCSKPSATLPQNKKSSGHNEKSVVSTYKTHFITKTFLIFSGILIFLLLLGILINFYYTFIIPFKGTLWGTLFSFIYPLTLFIVLLSLFYLIYYCLKDYLRLQKLTLHKKAFQKIFNDEFIDFKTENKIRNLIKNYIKNCYSFNIISKNEFEELNENLLDIHDLKDWYEIINKSVLSKIDEKTKNEIEFTAQSVGLSTALSPFKLVDSLIVLYKNSQLVLKIAKMNGIRLGIISELKLVFNILLSALSANLFEEYGEDFINNIIENMFSSRVADKITASKVADAISQGIFNSFITIRIGYLAQEKCRFIPWTEEQKKKYQPRSKNLISIILKKLTAHLLRPFKPGA